MTSSTEENKFKILLVDDEADNLALLHRTLRQKYYIMKTTSPLEALELIKETPVDLIISDHKMEEMDGVEFLKRSYEILPDAIRLLVTAYSDSQILIDAINYGKVYRYVKKPWEPEELIMTVDGAMEYYTLKKENDRLIYDLKELFAGTINAIIDALDAKDSYTLGRSRRVAFYALKMGKYFNLPKDDFGKLELAGLLHDIGMIGVPEYILNKTSELTQEEFEKVMKHVDHGVKILEDIKQLKDVVEIIKCHHERIDGSGYPRKLKGDEIPLSAQIIGIADTYDSLLSNRSFRKALTHQEAIEKLKEQIDTKFDKKIVEAFEFVSNNTLEELKEFEAKSIDEL